jgi:parallel beta-helix repeat protein
MLDHRRALLAVSLFALVFFAQPANASTTVSACGNLGSAGETYVLTSNVSATGNCLNITASNVFLDCQGFGINGNGVGAAINSSGQTNLTVRNCVIMTFDRGVAFSSVNSSLVQGVNATNITGQGSVSITLSFNDVINGTTTTNSFKGIVASQSANNIISNNNASNITQTGQELAQTGTINNTVVNNSCSLNSNFGCILLQLDASNNTIINNTIDHAFRGIECSVSLGTSTFGNSLFNNTIINSTTAYQFSSLCHNTTITGDTLYNNTNAFSLSSAINTTINHVRVYNTLVTIFSASGATNTTLINFTVGNTNGSVVWNYTNFTTASLSNSTFIIGQGIVSLNAGSVAAFNQTATVELRNLPVLADPRLRSMPTFTTDAFVTRTNGTACSTCTAIVQNVAARMITFNTSSFSSIAQEPCGNVSQSGILDQNVRAYSTCFTINASNTAALCTGAAEVLGNRTGFGFAATAVNNATVRNCVVNNFTSMIMFQSSNNSLTENNTLLNGTNGGLNYSSCFNGIIANNTVFSSLYGIHVNASSNVSVLNNYANATGATAAIDLFTSNLSLVNNNTALGGTAIRLLDSENNTITNNLAKVAGNVGITVSGQAFRANYNVIIGNLAISNTSRGININFVNNTIVKDNIGISNSSSGLRFASVAHSSIINNTGQSYTGPGLLLDSTNNVTLQDTTIIANFSWISNSVSFENNLTNTTFVNYNGTVVIPGNFTLSGSVIEINNTVLYIGSDQVMALNHSSSPNLSTVADVSFNNVNFTPGTLYQLGIFSTDRAAIIASGSTFSPVSSSYDSTNQRYTFRTSTFSSYALAQAPAPSGGGGGPPGQQVTPTPMPTPTPTVAPGEVQVVEVTKEPAPSPQPQPTQPAPPAVVALPKTTAIVMSPPSFTSCDTIPITVVIQNTGDTTLTGATAELDGQVITLNPIPAGEKRTVVFNVKPTSPYQSVYYQVKLASPAGSQTLATRTIVPQPGPVFACLKVPENLKAGDIVNFDLYALNKNDVLEFEIYRGQALVYADIFEGGTRYQAALRFLKPGTYLVRLWNSQGPGTPRTLVKEFYIIIPGPVEVAAGELTLSLILIIILLVIGYSLILALFPAKKKKKRKEKK